MPDREHDDRPPTPAGLELSVDAPPAPEPIGEAIASGLGALLVDRDVAEIASLEGAFVDVLRRGRRERLGVMLEGPLFALLREAGADARIVRMSVGGAGQPSGGRAHALVAGPLADGRVALRIVKALAHEQVTLEALAEEGVLPPGVGEELVAAVLEGAGVLVCGPARVARRRVVIALARALGDRLALYGAHDALAALLPVPLERGAPLVDKARAAVSLGADAVVALDVAPHAALELVRAELGVPLVLSVAAASMDALHVPFADARVPLRALAGTSAVIAHAPDGAARLVELHGPTRAGEGASQPAGAPQQPGAPATLASRGLTAAREPSTPAPPGAPAEVSGLRERPAYARAIEAGPAVDELPPLTALPAGWASDAPDDDPGWELGDAPPPGGDPEPHAPTVGPRTAPAPGTFDAALAAQSKARPSFAPRPPRPHPQTAALRGGDPFGGLTFEPPPGGAPPDDDVGPSVGGPSVGGPGASEPDDDGSGR